MQARHPESQRSAAETAAFFVALLATSIALSGALAHLFELPNKIGLSREDYFTVQQLYLGWWQFAYVLAVQLVALIVLLILERRQATAFRLVLGALSCLVAAQVLFWTFTFPANAATRDWSIAPPDWEQRRAQWEYSHAGGAILQLIGMGLLISATLARRSVGTSADGRRSPPDAS